MEGWKEALVFATFILSRLADKKRKCSPCGAFLRRRRPCQSPGNASGAASRPRQHQHFPSARRKSMPDAGLLRSDRYWCRKVGMSEAVSAAGRVGELFRVRLRTITSRSRLCFSIQHTERPTHGSDASVSRVAWFLIPGCFSSNQRSASVGEMMCLDVTLTAQMLPVLSAVKTCVCVCVAVWLELCASYLTTKPALSDSSCTIQQMLTGSFKPSLLNSSQHCSSSH